MTSTCELVLAEYRAAVGLLTPPVTAEAVLAALLCRDRLAQAVQGVGDVAVVIELAELDAVLKRAAPQVPTATWVRWRSTLTPSQQSWWWRLDEEETQRFRRRDLPWIIAAGLLMTATAGITIEIIRRLWSSGVDSFAVLGAGAALALTGVPISTHSRDAAGWLLDRLWPNASFRGLRLLGAALVSFLLVLLFAVAGLPALGTFFNNMGAQMLAQGNLSGASEALTRAVTLNPDYAIAYYNLAQRYVLIGDYDEAVKVHTQALQADDQQVLAYSGLGHALILQGKPAKAVSILRTGLSLAVDTQSGACVDPDAEICLALWADLGWAYLEAKRFAEAEEALRQALVLNPADAPALCNLALTAEALNRPPDEIIFTWESCLVNVQSVLLPARRDELAALARTHLRQWEDEP